MRMHTKTRGKIKIKINRRFLEFYGALMGDGCLSKVMASSGRVYYYVQLTGNKILDRDYHENYLIPLIKKEFNVPFRLKERKWENTIDLISTNKVLFMALKDFGFPVGKKGKSLKIPQKIHTLGWGSKKYLIRGLFDTDGCISARKDEGYKYPHIIISSQSIILIKQLYSMLRERGYPAWITKKKDEVRIKGRKNTIKWMNDIGSSNKRHTFKYELWLKKGILPVKAKGV